MSGELCGVGSLRVGCVDYFSDAAEEKGEVDEGGKGIELALRVEMMEVFR